MKRVLIAVVLVVILALSAVALDRIALMVWRARIQQYSEKLRAAAPTSTSGTLSLDRLLTSTADADRWLVPLLDVRLEGPKPTRITVDGNGGLNLWYEPPTLAWSRHVGLGQQRPMMQAADLYSYNDVYILKIWTVEARPGGKALGHPSVELDHGLPP
jgi:hypothetical protein